MSSAMSVPLPPKEHLERSLEFIRSQESQMRRALQSPQGRLLVAIKHASQMLGELRTSALPPKPYYELYNACFDALTLLQGYMREAHRTHHLTDIYEIVEYTGNVLPRLYLMITVGTAYLGSGDAPNQEVMKDMLEMCRGLQQPLRGLFLRYYLGQRTRDYLSTASRADLHFSIQFTLTNFVEMNKLWVRYQHQGHSREFGKRLEERRQLQTVVGSNIYRLAQLDSVDLLAFRELVLPSVLEQVIQCRDPLAQEYLLDVITQAFPAEYHLDTLDQYFDCVAALVPQTSKRTVLIASFNRVYEYAKATKDEREERNKTKNGLGTRQIDSNDAETGSNKSNTSNIAAVEAQESGKEDQNALQQHTENERESLGKTDSESDKNITDQTETSIEEHQNEAKSDTAEAQTKEGNEADVKIQDVVTAESENDSTSVSDNKLNAQNEKTSEASGNSATEAPNSVESMSTSGPEGKGETLVPETTESVDTVSKETAALKVSENDTQVQARAPPRDPFSDALALYWHTIQQLGLDSADRAALVRKLVELSELAEENIASLSEFFGYVVEVDMKPSIEFEELILALFDSHYELSDILNLFKQLPRMLGSQSKETRHAVAAKVLDNVVTSEATIGNLEQANQVFSLFGMLLKTGDLDVTKITQLLHLLRSSDGIVTLELLQLAYRSLREGGPNVVRKTFGVLVNTTLLLLRDENIAPVLVGKALKFVNKVCHDLTTFGESPLSSYRLYLVSVSAADYVGAEEAAYELFAEALSTYEEHISDTRQQVAALAIAIRTLQRTTIFSEENFEPLAQRCQQSCQQLLKKPDQCRMLLLVATLYWGNDDVHFPKVSETLSKALRVADSIMDTKTSLDLFLDLLESYLFFLGVEAEKPPVKVEEVNSLLALIKQNFDAAKTDENDGALAKLQSRMDRIHRYVESVENDVDEYQELIF